jgi:dihydropteroate synthase
VRFCHGPRVLLRARQFEFRFPRPALVMGVVNVTPDSFSDGGKYFDAGAAVDHALQLIEEGADLIDIGGESTRPAAAPVAEGEELRRVVPVIERLAGKIQVPISIDTMKPRVAYAALRAGASLVNDVGASREDPEMWRVVAEAGAGYVVMHMIGTPQTMQRNPTYRDVLAEVSDFFGNRLARLNVEGVPADQVVLDVGIGFGKTAEHNLQLLAGMQSFTKWERPLLLGVSRKSFIGHVTGEAEPAARLPGSLACASWAVGQGVNLVRTHDVAATRQALRMAEAILARAAQSGDRAGAGP